MKKSLLSMAALALIMAGCSNDEENVIDSGTAANAVPIVISQKVAGVESKAAVAVGDDMKAVILMVDGADKDATDPDYNSFKPKDKNTLIGNALANDAARANVANAQFPANTMAAEIVLTPMLYYPVDGDESPKSTWILGVSPQGNVSQTSVTFTQVDGLQDVMFAKAQAAGNQTAGGQKEVTLAFEHQTAQLTFVAKLSKDLAETEWKGKTVSVKDITIQKAQVPASLAFGTGNISWTEKDLTVAGCNTALSINACAPSVPVMVRPAANILVNIDLSVDGSILSYTNLTIKNTDTPAGNLSTQKGYSHKVTFTITPPTKAEGATEVKVSAKIDDWKTGAEGAVTIE